MRSEKPRPSGPSSDVGHPAQGRGVSCSLRVRDSSSLDLPFVVRLADRVFRVYGPYGRILGLFFLQRDVSTLVGTVGKKRVGFAMLSPMRWPTGVGHEVLDLSALAVRPAFQGMGIGRALLRQAIARAREKNAQWVVLHTAEENLRARRLFEREGFMYHDRIACFYPEGQTARRMMLDLERAAGS